MSGSGYCETSRFVSRKNIARVRASNVSWFESYVYDLATVSVSPPENRPAPRSIYISRLAVDPGDDRQRGNHTVPSNSDLTRRIKEGASSLSSEEAAVFRFFFWQ